MESYRHAAVGRYALGNFSEALQLIEKALDLDASSSALRFLQGKYLAAAGKHDLALAALRVLPANDETIAAVSADLDLAGLVAPRWLPGAKLAAEAAKLAVIVMAKARAEAEVRAKRKGEMVRISLGTFAMGNKSGCSEWQSATWVTLTKAFWLGKTPVTQRSWIAAMGSNPGHFKGELLPVESVSWDEAMALCRKLTEREQAAGGLPDGYVYMLPTEAQWELCLSGGDDGGRAGGIGGDGVV